MSKGKAHHVELGERPPSKNHADIGHDKPQINERDYFHYKIAILVFEKVRNFDYINLFISNFKEKGSKVTKP